MLKHIPELKGKNLQAMLNVIEKFLQEPTPRQVPKELIASSAPAILPIGKILAAIGLVLTIILFAAFLFVFPPKMLFAISALPLLMIAGFALMIAGQNIKSRKLKILRDGDLYEGRIVKISPTGMNVNGQNFFSVIIQFQKDQDTLINCHDLIRGDIIDNFFAIKDSETDDLIDLLYAKNSNHMAVIPLKIIYMSKYN